VVLLPALILGTQVKGARVLKVWREHHRLVTGFAGELYTKIPRIQGDKRKIVVVGHQVLLGKSVEAIDGITERSGLSDIFPGESG
jgi:hypothetical protein